MWHYSVLRCRDVTELNPNVVGFHQFFAYSKYDGFSDSFASDLDSTFVLESLLSSFSAVHHWQRKSKQLHTEFYLLTSVLTKLRYGDGAGNTVEENSSVFSLIRIR